MEDEKKSNGKVILIIVFVAVVIATGVLSFMMGMKIANKENETIASNETIEYGNGSNKIYVYLDDDNADFIVKQEKESDEKLVLEFGCENSDCSVIRLDNGGFIEFGKYFKLTDGNASYVYDLKNEEMTMLPDFITDYSVNLMLDSNKRVVGIDYSSESGKRNYYVLKDKKIVIQNVDILYDGYESSLNLVYTMTDTTRKVYDIYGNEYKPELKDYKGNFVILEVSKGTTSSPFIFGKDQKLLVDLSIKADAVKGYTIMKDGNLFIDNEIYDSTGKKVGSRKDYYILGTSNNYIAGVKDQKLYFLDDSYNVITSFDLKEIEYEVNGNPYIPCNQSTNFYVNLESGTIEFYACKYTYTYNLNTKKSGIDNNW